MPTNQVTPNWICDICGRSYGKYLEEAERCERSPVPVRPRLGSLVLTCNHRGPKLSRVLAVAPLVRGDMGSGSHYWWVTIEGHDGGHSSLIYEWAQAGHATVLPETFGRTTTSSYFSGRRWSNADELLLQVAHEAGLVQSPPDWAYTSSDRVVGPLDPAHRELLDLLELQPQAIAERSDARSYAYTTALIAAGGRADRATVMHHARPVSSVQLEVAWKRWWDGEDITVPLPKFRFTRKSRSRNYSRTLTASKLRKPQLQAIADAGTDWPARYDHDAFVQRLLPKVTLPMEDQSHPQFGLPTIAILSAKGGVGKSTVAAALGVAMADRGYRTLIVDCDPLNSSQASLWGLGPLPVDEGRVLLRPAPTGYPRLTAISPGQFLSTSDRANWSDETTRQWVAFVAANTDLAETHAVLLDLPAGGGPLLDNIYAHTTPTAHLAVLVVTGHRLVADATTRWTASNKGWDRCPTVLVENQSHLPNGKRVIGNDPATAALAKAVGLKLAASLPITDDHLVLGRHRTTQILVSKVFPLPAPEPEEPNADL